MSILFLLIIFSVAMAVVFLIAFVISARSGQFDDTNSPAHRILFEDRQPGIQQNDKKPAK